MLKSPSIQLSRVGLALVSSALYPMKKILTIILLLLISAHANAGGDTFDLKVISFTKVNSNEYHFKFTPLSTPYGQSLEDFTDSKKSMTLIIKFGCSQKLLTCLFSKRTFSKQEHKNALKLLTEQAIPDQRITFGIMGPTFYPIPNKKGVYRSNGLFKMDDNIVGAYSNSHL